MNGENSYGYSVAKERIQQCLRLVKSLIYLPHTNSHSPKQQDSVNDGDDNRIGCYRRCVHTVDKTMISFSIDQILKKVGWAVSYLAFDSFMQLSVKFCPHRGVSLVLAGSSESDPAIAANIIPHKA